MEHLTYKLKVKEDLFVKKWGNGCHIKKDLIELYTGSVFVDWLFYIVYLLFTATSLFVWFPLVFSFLLHNPKEIVLQCIVNIDNQNK